MTHDTMTNEPAPNVNDHTYNVAPYALPSSVPVKNGVDLDPNAVPKAGKLSPPKSSGARVQDSKTEIVLKKLHLARGVTIAQIMEATDWQAHSVRGFMSAVARKKLGLNLVSEIGKDGQRRYRISERSGEPV